MKIITSLGKHGLYAKGRFTRECYEDAGTPLKNYYCLLEPDQV